MPTQTATLFSLPEKLVRQGGPFPGDYGALGDWLERAGTLVATGVVTREQITGFWRALGPDYLARCAQGHALAKPRGYAGDFEMMDLIYDRRVSTDERFGRWDLFFHGQPAVAAVRNRAGYIGAVLDRARQRATGRPLRLLDLACGSARHLAPWLKAHPDTPIELIAVDNDDQALARAAERCGPCLDARSSFRFLSHNLLRVNPADFLAAPVDVVWSSGLFDYFSDASFIRVARRLLAVLRPGGELVLGNFGPANPSRSYTPSITSSRRSTPATFLW